MSIALNISKVKSETLPYLSKSKTSITDAYGKCNSLKNSLPTNFSYRNYLNSLSNQLYTLRQDITNVEKLINDKLSKVNSIEKKADSRTDQLKSLASKLAAPATLNMHIGPATVSVNKSTMNYIEKGFEQTQNFLDKIGAIISSGVSSITEKNVTDYKGANVDVKKDWDSFFSSAAKKVNDVLEWNSKTSDKIDRWFEQRIEDTGAILGEVVSYIAENVPRVLANFTNELLGFTKGVGRLAEGVVDGLVGIGTVLTSIPTVAADIVDGVVTNDWSFERVSSIWEWTQSFVSTEYVNGWYNSYYEGYGKILNQYADDVFDSTGAATQVLDQVGYFGGAIASGQWIAGAGSAALGCEMTTATSTGLFSFVGGLGRNSEQAWNDGASTLEGMLYGTVRGIYEGLQTSLGVKINLFKPFGESGFLSQIGNTLTHVMADTVDGGSGAIFDPLFKMIYSPNQKNQEVIMQSINYNEKGEKINDVKWEDLSFGEKYGLLFEYSGGWDTVKTQAIAGGVLSLLSEIPDIGGAFKNTKASQTSIPKQASKAELEMELSKIDNMIETNKTEWHELYQKTKTPEYKKAIENLENGYAGSLSDMEHAIFIKNRMESLESEMEGLIKNKQSIEKSLDEVIEQNIKRMETDNVSSTKNIEVENNQKIEISSEEKLKSEIEEQIALRESYVKEREQILATASQKTIYNYNAAKRGETIGWFNESTEDFDRLIKLDSKIQNADEVINQNSKVIENYNVSSTKIKEEIDMQIYDINTKMILNKTNEFELKVNSFNYITLDTLKEIDVPQKVNFSVGGKKYTYDEVLNIIIPKQKLFSTLDGIFAEGNITKTIDTLKVLSVEQTDYMLKNYENLSDEGTGKFIKKVVELYKNGSEVAAQEYDSFYHLFREHAFKHSLEVTKYSEKLAKNVKEKINLDETLTAAISHDFGMRGGVMIFDDSMMDKIIKQLIGQDATSSEIDFYKSLKGSVKNLDDAQILLTKELSNGKILFEEQEFVMNFARGSHPLNSALDIINYSDSLPEGVDKEVVSLLAMSHSKSTSGISYFNSKEQWLGCVDKLKKAAEFKKIKFDEEKLCRMIKEEGEFEKGTFERLQLEATLIRDGDAMSDVVVIDDMIYMQNNSFAKIENLKPRTDYSNPECIVFNKEKGEYVDIGADIEADNIRDISYHNGTPTELKNKFSKRTHAGELNTKYDSRIYTSYDGKLVYRGAVYIKDANQYPYSTFDNSIKERLGELNTYTNCDERYFEIAMPKELEGTEIAKWYQNKINKVIDGYKEQLAKDIAKNVIDEDTYNLQLDFYENLTKSLVFI